MASEQGSEHHLDTEMDTSIDEGQISLVLERLNRLTNKETTLLMQLRKSISTWDFDAPSSDPVRRLRQLQIIRAAYESLSATEPSLAVAGSSIKELLALRSTYRTAQGIQQSTEELQRRIQAIREQLGKERVNLHDGRLISTALERRLGASRQDELQQTLRPSERSVASLQSRLHKRRKFYDGEVKRLIKAFNWFIEQYLAAMLAAEEAGGPIVGELVGDDLGTQETKSRDHDVVEPSMAAHRPTHQRSRSNVSTGGAEAETSGASNTTSLAGSQFRALTEELMNACVSAGDDGSSPYVELARESAAARFLVRAKIAQFSPRDARRLRLIDVGKRLDL